MRLRDVLGVGNADFKAGVNLTEMLLSASLLPTTSACLGNSPGRHDRNKHKTLPFDGTRRTKKEHGLPSRCHSKLDFCPDSRKRQLGEAPRRTKEQNSTDMRVKLTL